MDFEWDPGKAATNLRKARRGAVVPAGAGKTRITIRLDDDVLEWFRGQADEAGGGGYQALINQALRATMEGRESLEETLRRVVREELEPRKRLTPRSPRETRKS